MVMPVDTGQMGWIAEDWQWQTGVTWLIGVKLTK
jgi:hypothetical protein